MKQNNRMGLSCAFLFAGLLAMGMMGCKSSSKDMSTNTSSAKPAPAAEPVAMADNRPTIRINAGSEAAMTDTQGVKWAADSGFEGGDVVDRPDLAVTGTKTPELYHTERYSMDSYSFAVPNGKYLLRLHFSEDYEGNTDPTSRVFTYAVKDGDAKTGKLIKEVKDFSPWKAAGAAAKVYIDEVPMDVTNGRISITFTPQAENPQVNAIEILPR